MNEIEYLLFCLNKIDSHYLEVMGFNQNNVIYQQAAENAFTAELYHQLKTEQNLYSQDELKWHFDLNKERANSIRPDLVLHHSPIDRNDQRIFIEVKTSKNTSQEQIINDLNKLKKAVLENNWSNQLGFKLAFYILVNIDLTKIRENIGMIDNSLWDKIHILNYLNEEDRFINLQLNEI